MAIQLQKCIPHKHLTVCVLNEYKYNYLIKKTYWD